MKKTNSKLPRLVANDNGYADHKLAWLDENDNIMTIKVPALIEPGVTFGSTQGGRFGVYRAEEVEYTCSARVHSPMNLRSADYPVSVHNRVLMTHALTRAGLLDMPLTAAVTLPFRDYFNEDGTINADLRDASSANFMKGNVELVDSESRPHIQSVAVYAEALSAWFDWAMDEKGKLTTEYEDLCELEGEMLIVDIGGSTTDLASIQITNEVMQGQMLISHQKSGTERVGVLDAKNRLEELMRNRLSGEGKTGLTGHTGGLSETMVATALEKGTAPYAGQRWDFEQERALACKAVVERITRFLTSKVGNLDSYFAILVVGGGSVVFKKWLQQILPNAVFSDEFANARGALKFLMEKRNRES